MVGFFLVWGTVNAYTATWALTDDPAAGIPVAALYFSTMMAILLIREKPKPSPTFRVEAKIPERYR